MVEAPSTQSVVMPTTENNVMTENQKVMTSIAVIECLLMIADAFGITMLFVLMRSQKMKQYSFSVYFSLAVIFDTLTIFWNSLQDMYEYDVNHLTSLEENAALSYTFGCGILEQMDGWLPLTSARLMVFLCIDRFFSICYLNISQIICRRPIAFLICCILVCVTFIFELPWPLIVPDKADNDPSDGPVLCGDEATDNLNGFAVVEIVFLYFVPVAVVSVLDVLVLVKLCKKQAFRLENSLTEFGKQQNRMNVLNKTIFYLLVITVVTWLPHAIVNLTEKIYFDIDDNNMNSEVENNMDYAWHATLVMWLFTFVQDFYMLMLMSGVYRKEMHRQCACLPWCRKVEHKRLDVNNELPDNDDGEM